MTLTDRLVLITGGARIGARVATAVADRGADVALVYRQSSAEAERTAAEVRAAGRRCTLVQADLSDPEAAARVVDRVVEQTGRLDVLVNMASIYRSVPLETMTLAEWEAPMAVDLRAAFLCAQASITWMRQAGGGRIVNVTDWVAASRRPRYTGYVAYYVAKSGVIALTEALALELAKDGILVNAIAPGPIIAPPGTSDEEMAEVERATPIGRWGGADEIVKAALFLIETDFTTGETIRVDGGRHLR